MNRAIKPEFHFNAGKTGQAFAQNPTPGGRQHPYFALAKKDGLEQRFNRMHYKYLENYSRKKLVGKKVERADVEMPIEFNNKGIKEAFNQPHKDYNDKNLLILYMDTVLKKAEYLGKRESKNQNAYIPFVHLFRIKVNGNDSYVIAREVILKKKPKEVRQLVFYSITDREIKK